LASSRGARRAILDYLLDMSAVLRSELLALEPLTTVFRGALKDTHRGGEAVGGVLDSFFALPASGRVPLTGHVISKLEQEEY